MTASEAYQGWDVELERRGTALRVINGVTEWFTLDLALALEADDYERWREQCAVVLAREGQGIRSRGITDGFRREVAEAFPETSAWTVGGRRLTGWAAIQFARLASISLASIGSAINDEYDRA